MEDVIRTVKVKIDVPSERCDDHHQTKDQFLHCANTTAAWAWRHPHDYCVTAKQKVENALADVFGWRRTLSVCAEVRDVHESNALVSHPERKAFW